MPAACDHAAVNAVFGRFSIDVIRQRYVALAELQNLGFFDFDAAEFVHRAGNVILEVTIVWCMGEPGAAHEFSRRWAYRVPSGCWRRIRAIFTAIFSALKMSLMIATEFAPARQTCPTFCSLTPPMATIGSFTLARISRSMSMPRAV